MSFAGDSILERARSTTFALLGTIAAVGLAIIAFAVQQEWPLVGGSPIPGAPSETGTVHISRGVALEGGSPSLAAGHGVGGGALAGSAGPAAAGGRAGNHPGRRGSDHGEQLVAGSVRVVSEGTPPGTAAPPAPVETTTQTPEASAPPAAGAPSAAGGSGRTQSSIPSGGKALAKGPGGSGKALAKGPSGSGKALGHAPGGHGSGSNGKGAAKAYVPSSSEPSTPALPQAPGTSAPQPPASAGNGVAHSAWGGVQESAAAAGGSHGHGLTH